MQDVWLLMASDVPTGRSTGPDGRVEQWWPMLCGPDGAQPVLDMRFDSSTLPMLRTEVRARAVSAGLPEGRAEYVVLAVHEVAANAVRLWRRDGAAAGMEPGRDVAMSG